MARVGRGGGGVQGKKMKLMIASPFQILAGNSGTILFKKSNLFYN